MESPLPRLLKKASILLKVHWRKQSSGFLSEIGWFSLQFSSNEHWFNPSRPIAILPMGFPRLSSFDQIPVLWAARFPSLLPSLKLLTPFRPLPGVGRRHCLWVAAKYRGSGLPLREAGRLHTCRVSFRGKEYLLLKHLLIKREKHLQRHYRQFTI